MNWSLNFFIRKQITARESDLQLAKNSLKHATEKEAQSMEESKEYSIGFWYGLKCNYEDEIRRIERELEFLKSELKESEQHVS